MVAGLATGDHLTSYQGEHGVKFKNGGYMKFSIVKNATSNDVTPENVITIDQLSKVLASDKINQITNKYRQIYVSNKDAAKQYKKSSVPAFAVSGVFKERNTHGLITPSNMLQIDIDLKEITDIRERAKESYKIISHLEHSRHLVVPHISLSCGVKALFWFDTGLPVTKELLKTVGKIATDYVLGFLDERGYDKKLKVDSVFDVPRLCFFAYYPNVKPFDINFHVPFSMNNETQKAMRTEKQKIENLKSFTLPEFNENIDYGDVTVMIGELTCSSIIQKKITEFLNSPDGEKYVTLRNAAFTIGGLCLRDEKESLQQAVDVLTATFDFKLNDPIDRNREKILDFVMEGAEKPFSLMEFLTYNDKGQVVVNEHKYKLFLNKLFRIDQEERLYFINDNNTVQRIQREDRVSAAVIDQMEKMMTNDSFNIFYKALKFSHLKPAVIKSLVSTTNIKFLKSDRDSSYFIFKNGVVEVSKNGMRLRPFEAYHDKGFVDADHIIDRYFTFDPEAYSEYDLFMQYTCSVLSADGKAILDTKKYAALRRVIGYLLHSYSKSTDKGIIFTEKNLSIDKWNAKGGSGKTQLVNGVLAMYNMEKLVDGKGKDQDDRFYLDNLKANAQIVAFDDLHHRFDTTLFFTMIGRAFDVCRKTRDKITIGPVKVVITSNYPPKMSQNESLARRLYIMELNRFFNLNNTPSMYLSKMLYEEWDSDEWNSFYNVMIQMSYEYHCDRTLLEYDNYNDVRENLLRINMQMFDYLSEAISVSEDECFIVASSELVEIMKHLMKIRNYTSVAVANDLKIMNELKIFDVTKRMEGGRTVYYIRNNNDSNNMIKTILQGVE